MEPGGPMSRSQGLSKDPILSRINPIPRIDSYFFRIHSTSNNVLSYMPKLSKWSIF